LLSSIFAESSIKSVIQEAIKRGKVATVPLNLSSLSK
jgi:hypothetical protein